MLTFSEKIINYFYECIAYIRKILVKYVKFFVNFGNYPEVLLPDFAGAWPPMRRFAGT